MLKPLTDAEVAKVMLATRGESYAHRRWSQDVVRAFASAEVITAGGRHGAVPPPHALLGLDGRPPLLPDGAWVTAVNGGPLGPITSQPPSEV